MITGAASAPSRPAADAIVSIRPIAAGCTPARTSRRVTVTSTRVTEKLIPAPQQMMARITGCRQTNRSPSAMSAETVRRPGLAPGAGNGVRSRVIDSAESA